MHRNPILHHGSYQIEAGRVPVNVLPVEAFGAVGNNENHDDYSAIQEAIYAAEEQGGGTICLDPRKRYYIGDTLKMAGDVTVNWDGGGATLINTQMDGSPLLQVGSPISETSLTSALAGGESSIQVNTIMGFATGDEIAVFDDDGGAWVTIISDAYGDTITLANPVPATFFASAGNRVYKPTTDGAGVYSHSRIRQVHLIGNPSSGNGLEILNAHRMRLIQCWVGGHGKTGIYAHKAWDSFFRDCRVYSNAGHGVFLGDQNHGVGLMQCEILASSRSGVYIRASDAVQIHGCDLEGNDVAVEVANHHSSRSEVPTIKGCFFEANEVHLDIGSGSAGPLIRAPSIEGCFFYPGSGGGDVNISRTESAFVSGNVFIDCPINIEAAAQGTIWGENSLSGTSSLTDSGTNTCQLVKAPLGIVSITGNNDQVAVNDARGNKDFVFWDLVNGHEVFAILGSSKIPRFNGPTQSSVGAAGNASPLPATPTGYLKIYISGELRVVPFYAES